MKNIFVKLKIGKIEINHIREIIEEIEKENYTFKNWFPRPGLKEKNTDFVSRLYIGQSYDKNQFDLVEDGWINDHCEICFKTLGDKKMNMLKLQVISMDMIGFVNLVLKNLLWLKI